MIVLVFYEAFDASVFVHERPYVCIILAAEVDIGAHLIEVINFNIVCDIVIVKLTPVIDVGVAGLVYLSGHSVHESNTVLGRTLGHLRSNARRENSPYKEIDDNRYYFKSNGQMLESGWYKDSSGDWYLAKSNGALYSYEWYQENGKWYYFNYSGKMICDRTNYPIGGKYYDFDSHGVCTNPYSGRTKTT